jgi:hypothetical protein
MHVGIVEAGDDGSPASVNDARLRAPQEQNLSVLTRSSYPSVRYGDRFDKRGYPVRGNLGVVQNELSRHGSLRSGFFQMD